MFMGLWVYWFISLDITENQTYNALFFILMINRYL